MLRKAQTAAIIFFSLIPCFVAVEVAESQSPQNPVQVSTQPTSPDPVIYLPPDGNKTQLLCVILANLKEPSLLAASKDSSVVSYRVSFFSPIPVHLVAVRLLVNPDGTGEITSAVSSDSQSAASRTKNNVRAADIERLLQLIEKAQFWASSSVERAEPASGRKAYVMDGSVWMMEGVRNGQFHYVSRSNPTLNPLTEIGCYLAKDLVKIDGAPIPMAGCSFYQRQAASSSKP